MRIYISDISLFFLAGFIFLSLNPYYVWGFYPYVFISFIIVFIYVVCVTPHVFSKNKFIFSQITFILSFLLHVVSGASYEAAIAISFTISVLVGIKCFYFVRMFEIFKKIYAIMLLPGILLWFIHLFFGFDFLMLGHIDGSVVPNQLKVEQGFGYIVYPFSVVLDYMLYSPFYRFSGPFDEPGVVGTVSALLLVSNKVRLRSLSDIIILCSGLVSFSLAFYLLLSVYLLIKSFYNARIFVYLLIFVFSIFALAEMNHTVKRYSVDRLIVVDGHLAGDNRVGTEFDDYYKKFLSSDLKSLLFGDPHYGNSGESSWKVILVRSGFVGIFLFLLFFLNLYLSRVRTFNPDSVLFTVVFMASVYQRPEVIYPFFAFVFVYGAMNFIQEKNINRIKPILNVK